MKRVDREDILVNKVKDAFRDEVVETTVFRGDVTHLVTKKSLQSVCNFLKTDPDLKMSFIVDVLGVDLYPQSPRFEVVYLFYSVLRKHRIRIKVRLDENETLPSITHIWAGAEWPERETYDMFGILFEGNPNMKRIYLAEDWEGFPLRKDYPLRGYKDQYNPFGVDKDKE